MSQRKDQRARIDPRTEAEQQRHKDIEKYLAEQSEQDFLWLMSDKRGRRFIWELLGQCGIFQTSFTGNSQTFFNEGRRDVGLKHLKRVNELCPDKYVVMAQEANEQEDLQNG